MADHSTPSVWLENQTAKTSLTYLLCEMVLMAARFTKQECLEALNEAADRLGHTPTRAEYREVDISPSDETLRNKFGSWNAAKQQAGLAVPDEYTRADCIEALEEAAEKLGQAPSQSAYLQLDLQPGVDTIKRLFGSWNAAKEEAGLVTWEKNPGTESVSEDYFAEIDTAEKAYWLGFIYADGYVRRGNELGLTLQKRDEHHLRTFADALDSTYKIQQIEAPESRKVGTQIRSEELVSDLATHGVVARKTHKDTLPDLDADAIPHFIRGYFDGDGSFVIQEHDSYDYEEGQWKLRSASRHRLERIWGWLQKAGVTSGNIYENGTTPRLVIWKKKDVRAIWNYLYPDGLETAPTLKRKTMLINQLLDTNQEVN